MLKDYENVTMKLDEKVINQIVETVVQKLADQESENKETANNSESATDGTDGVFRDMTVCIQATIQGPEGAGGLAPGSAPQTDSRHTGYRFGQCRRLWFYGI